MQTFQTGKTYSTRSICDSNCIISITIARRTAKTIWTTCGKQLRVSEYDGAETVKPYGTYSMCPIIRANDPSVIEVDNDTLEKVVADGYALFQKEQLDMIYRELKAAISEKPSAKVYRLEDYRKRA